MLVDYMCLWLTDGRIMICELAEVGLKDPPAYVQVRPR